MSFEFEVSEKDLAASVFLKEVHEAIVKAALRAKSENGLTQRQVAERLGVDKSSISRILCGRGNPTSRTLGEIAWALGTKFALVEYPYSQVRNMTFSGSESELEPTLRIHHPATSQSEFTLTRKSSDEFVLT